MRIELPISKSIANRLLMLQATHGDELMPVSDSMPDDVQLLHRALTTLHNPTQSYTTLHLSNCGTAMRFLTAFCAQLEGQTTILDGVERMHHRPIGQLVDALREIGADVEYLGEEGFPPLRIKGCILDKHRIVTINNLQSTQFVSALLLIGANVQTDSTSPYITLTRALIEQYALASFTEDSATSVRRSGGNKISSVENKINLDFVSEANRSPIFLERDWSSAAFWYEYVALHGGEITLPGLSRDSLQGDKVVADIFAHLGVHTIYTDEGITIKKNNEFLIQQHKQLNPTTLRGNQLPAAPGAKANNPCRSRELIRAEVVDIVVDNTLSLDFANCPDLYPVVALTCERLGVEIHATGVESLPLKESDRLRAVAEHRTDADHRMAMALLIAGYEVDDTACISKSYPQFLGEYRKLKHPNITIVIPRRGINDEGKGKKHALYRLISAAGTEYVWMQDDDVAFKTAELLDRFAVGDQTAILSDNDLLILPLRMESENEKPSLLERLQMAEYAAIQQLTIETAKRGHAVMCSGANLIAKRDRWLESYEDLHPEIPSGDDMFLLESFKRRGLKIAVSESEELTAIVRPHTSWSAFWKQRMRWAGKAPKYTDKDILCCGAIVLIANVIQVLCPVTLIVKFPIEYHLIKKRDKSVGFGTALLLEVVYPFYMLICLIGGLLRRRW